MLKNKKVSLLVCLSLLLTMFLTACGTEQTNSKDPAKTSPQSQETEKSNGESELAQGVTDQQILVGHLGPQTGAGAVYDSIRKGIDAYFNYVNENGGINGRNLKQIAYDDEYMPGKTVNLAKKLVEEDKVFAILGNGCTSCNAATKDYYVKTGIPIVMLNTGAKEFVDPPIANYFGSGFVNYRYEAKVFVDYAIKELGAKKIAIAYQNDDFGKEGFIGAKKQLENYDAEVVQEVNFQNNDVDFSAQAQKLKEANPDVILNFALSSPAANLKKAMYKIGFKDMPYIVSGVGGNDLNLFDMAGNEVWDGTITGATFPMPNQSNDESMQLYKKQMNKYFPDTPLAGFGQVGWAEAEVFVEALKRTEGDLTWENFLKSFNTFDNWKGSMYEGVTFNKDNHYGVTSLLIVQAKNGEIVPISDSITFDPTTGKINFTEK